MQGEDTVIRLLNQALRIELTAINQYFLHARMYKDWGLVALGKHEHDESIEEMQRVSRSPSGMSTDSMVWPSSSFHRNLRVPSSLVSTTTGSSTEM